MYQRVQSERHIRGLELRDEILLLYRAHEVLLQVAVDYQRHQLRRYGTITR
jgi:hypothetical protein